MSRAAGENAARLNFLRGRTGESGLERGEKFDLRSEEEVEVAAEAVVGRLKDFVRGLAHFHELPEMAGESFGDVVGGFEAHELRESGLVERVGGAGAREEHAGLVAHTDRSEAVGNGDKVFRAEVILAEEMFEKKTGFVGFAETVERDGLQAVEDGGELLDPLG